MRGYRLARIVVVLGLLVGRIDAESIGAVSLGRALFVVAAVFGIGMLLGLDTLVSRSFGAGDLDDAHLSLRHGVYLGVGMALPLILILRAVTSSLDLWGIDPGVLERTTPYLRAVTWSLLPLLLYAALRRYLQAINLVRPVMFALISANLINALFNWIWIFGNLGAPKLGAAGAGWATLFSMSYLALFLALTAVLHGRRATRGPFDLPWDFDGKRLASLIRLGTPAAIQLLLEVGVFGLGTALAARLDPFSLAAHQIALTAASVTFMVPLGISSAGAVRVGQALGRRDPLAAGRAGWTALLLGAGFMLIPALGFVVLRFPLLRAFTKDDQVISIGASLLLVAAVFQLFDGVQIVATGALRGAGDTRTPMIWTLISYWALGLPVGYVFCFKAGWGVVGLWIGLSVGLVVIGVVLLVVWSRRVRSWHAGA
jgi:MATE family multidrug resistance protein